MCVIALDFIKISNITLRVTHFYFLSLVFIVHRSEN